MLANWHSSIARWIASYEVPSYMRVLWALVLSMLPVVIASLLLPPRGCVFAVMISMVLCYRLSAPIQSQLFGMNLDRANVFIALPLQILFGAWAMLLLYLDRPGQVSASLFSALLLTFTAIAPLLRRARSKRTQRRFSYPVTFGAAALIVIAMQIVCLWVTP